MSPDAKGLLRVDIAIDLLIPDPMNPNEMEDAEFNMLYSNMEDVGWTDPALVRPHPDKPGYYMIVGGHHRVEVGKLLGYEKAPCTILPVSVTDDQAKFQMVRHNVIRGKMSPQKFMALYESLSAEYSADIAREAFGFSNEEEFRRLIKKTAESLPKDMKKEFEEAAKEVKTIDELASLLNKMFTMHGDTLPYGYMVVDFGGKDSIWIRMQAKDRQHFDTIAANCKSAGKTLDSILRGVVRDLALDVSKLATYLEKADNVDIPTPANTDLSVLDS